MVSSFIGLFHRSLSCVSFPIGFFHAVEDVGCAWDVGCAK